VLKPGPRHETVAPALMGKLFGAFHPGQRFETPARTITEADIVAFAGLTGDFNPVHTDDVFAAATDFGGRVAHGPMGIGIAFGLASRLDLIDGTVIALLSVSWEFKAPMRPGDAIKALIEVKETRAVKDPARGILVLDFRLTNQHRETLQNGTAALLMRRTPHPEAGWGEAVPEGTVNNTP
jgi:acyl dehydratase